jgi:hypothetical protein
MFVSRLTTNPNLASQFEFLTIYFGKKTPQNQFDDHRLQLLDVGRFGVAGVLCLFFCLTF